MPTSAFDNVQSSDNFRLIMPRDRSISYMCRKNVRQKRGAVASETDKVPPPKKRRVTVKTVQSELDRGERQMNASVWLKYDKVDRE